MPYLGNFSSTYMMTIAPFAQPQLFQPRQPPNDTTQLQDTIKRSIQKSIIDTTNLNDSFSIIKQMIRNMTDSLIQGDTRQSLIGHVINDNTNLQDSLAKSLTRSMQDDTTLNDIMQRFAVKGILVGPDVTTLSDYVANIFGRTLVDNTILAEALTRAVSFTGVIMSNEPQVNLIDTEDLTVDVEIQMI